VEAAELYFVSTSVRIILLIVWYLSAVSVSENVIDLFTDAIFPVHNLDLSASAPIFSFKLHTFHQDKKQQANYPHRHSFFQVLYVTAGQGFHIVDFEALPISPPVLFFVSPGQVHSWQLESPLQGYGLLFGPDFLVFDAVDSVGFDKLALFHSLAHTPLHLDPENAASLRATIELLAQEYAVREFNHASVVSAYLHILLSKIQRLYARIEPDISINTSAELVRRFKQLVSSHYLGERSIQFYADQLGVSTAHLAKRVKAVTGCTIGQVIRQEVTMEAKRLLINTNLTVEQISYQLGFNDPPYFGRFFKREASCTPGEFRQDIFEKYQIKRA
jgi:AraC family transcriptional regulator, transcriptional activator of pobA